MDGVTFEDRGAARLKNIEDAVGIVRVVPEGDDPSSAFRSAESTDERPIRVVLADDSVLFREGVARVLGETGFSVVGQATDADELFDLVAREQPDLVVTDIRMPPSHSNEGLIAAQRIRSEYPNVAVVVLSQYVETRHAIKLLQRSPERVGYLLKDRVSDIAEFAGTIRRVSRGGSAIDPDVVAQLLRRGEEGSALASLTDRERELLGMMAEGRSNQAISEVLFLSPKTVETHVGSIFAKLGLVPTADDHRRVLAVLMYLRGT
ncbi:MAG: response regulator transcription factor [Actinobacteria bacterium]|nr:MAG: response regulator transcription factor [Actinomycetota bacterium]